MLGKDCERILSSINSIKDKLGEAIKLLAPLCSYQLISESEYSHPHDSDGKISNYGHEEYKEKEKPINGSEYVSSIISLLDSFEDDFGKLSSLRSGLYTESTSFNNSIGSPWSEINKLKESIMVIKSFGFKDLKFIGEKCALLSLLNMAISYAVDAKWALITYHDYIQRGYDNKYNDNNPSITFKKNYKTNELDVRATIGNKNQDFEENVHIKKETLDPF